MPSLIASAAVCECASMMPGVIQRPAASITSAPAGTATFAPTAAIRPSRITIVPRGIVPLLAVMMVALVIAISRDGAGTGMVSAGAGTGLCPAAAGGAPCAWTRDGAAIAASTNASLALAAWRLGVWLLFMAASPP